MLCLYFRTRCRRFTLYYQAKFGVVYTYNKEYCIVILYFIHLKKLYSKGDIQSLRHGTGTKVMALPVKRTLHIYNKEMFILCVDIFAKE